MNADTPRMSDRVHGAASAEYDDLTHSNTHESHNLPDLWTEASDEYRAGYDERWAEG